MRADVDPSFSPEKSVQEGSSYETFGSNVTNVFQRRSNVENGLRTLYQSRSNVKWPSNVKKKGIRQNESSHGLENQIVIATHAAPIPLLAPVITTTLSLIPDEVSISGSLPCTFLPKLII
jgi:hypothetical protein